MRKTSNGFLHNSYYDGIESQAQTVYAYGNE